MKTSSTASWDQFLRSIEDARETLKCGDQNDEEPWYRGHQRAEYPLLPSLFRYYGDPNDGDWDDIWETEQDLFWEFSTRARELHTTSMSDWDILFTMRHYGAPTRLLDWTEVLGVAVYFALENYSTDKQPDHLEEEASPCVWVLNPYRLNRQSWEPIRGDLVYPAVLGWDEGRREYYDYGELLMEERIDWPLPVAVYPRQKSNRVQAQRGWFTIHGDEFVPIEGLDHSSSFCIKVELPIEAIPAAKDFLVTAGIDRYLLFPDLDNLSKHLIDMHFHRARGTKPKHKKRKV